MVLEEDALNKSSILSRVPGTFTRVYMAESRGEHSATTPSTHGSQRECHPR